MLKRAIALENAIRDSSQQKLEIFFNQELFETTIKHTIKKFDKELLELTLKSASYKNIFGDAAGPDHIRHLKIFESEAGLQISFDPYDERINEIEERDNEVYECESYEFKRKQI